MVSMIRAASLIVFTLIAGAAYADAPRMAPMPKPVLNTVEAWGVRNASCAEWTNACQVCSRDSTGKPQCSTPGIACVPKAMVCLKKK